MLSKGKHIHEIPIELQKLLDKENVAKEFFDALAKSHKQRHTLIGLVQQRKKKRVKPVQRKRLRCC